MTKVIRSNKKGNISYNIAKELYYVQFGNVYLTLDFYQYKDFEEVIEKIEVDSRISNNERRIKIPFESDNITLLLTPEDVIDLKALFGLLAQSTNEIIIKARYSMN